MKTLKSILILLAAMVFLGANAESRSVADALRIAREHQTDAGTRVASTLNPELAYTSTEGGYTCFYVVNYPEGNGFAIVPADDALPEVIGYVEEGSFDAENLPCNVAWWLESYQRQIYLYYSGRLTLDKTAVEPTRAGKAAIAPLCSTKWNQDSPYNDLCPMDNGEHSVTGCVATAMAQVMKRWNYPEVGTGTIEGFNINAYPLHWAQMLDVYTSKEYTTEQGAAVASLMLVCGKSVRMDYTAYASGAYSNDVPVALIDNFGYNPAMELCFRDYYSFTGWNNLVYSELEAGRPVYYSGQSRDGGHAFVCDGYSGNDYFHFNWGWGGAYDGYFMLNALNPGGGGIGSSDGGYNANQMIITGVTSEHLGTNRQAAIISTESFVWQGGNSYAFTNGKEGLAYNPLGYQQSIIPGLKVVGVSNPDYLEYSSSGKSESLRPYYGIEGITCSLPASMPDGEYHVMPAFQSDGNWYDIQVPYSMQTYVVLKVANGQATLINEGTGSRKCQLIVNSEEGLGLVAENTNMALRVVVSNVGDLEYMGKLKLVFTDPAYSDYKISTEEYVILPEKRATTVTFTAKYPSWQCQGMEVEILDDNDKTVGKFSVDAKAEIQQPNYYDLTVQPVSPNFAYTNREYSISTVIKNPDVRTTVTKSIIISLNSINDEGTLTPLFSLKTEPIAFGPMQSVTISSEATKFDLPSGDYYWTVTTGDGDVVGSAFPLMLLAGEYRDDSTGLYYAFENAKSEAMVLNEPSGDGYGEDVVIPAYFEGVPVRKIEGGTFTFDKRLRSISLPSTLNAINPAEYYCADNLKKLKVGNSTPFTIAADALPLERFAKVELMTPAGSANLYKRTAVWKEFFMPSWTFELEDGYSIAAGLEDDPETGKPYSPYYVSSDEALQLTVAGPESWVIGTYTLEDGTTGTVHGQGSLILPAIACNGKLVVSGAASVGSITDAVNADVYTLDGKLIMKAATPERIATLPAGIYIVGGKKLIVD